MTQMCLTNKEQVVEFSVVDLEKLKYQNQLDVGHLKGTKSLSGL
jgi:hypothetical protein